MSFRRETEGRGLADHALDAVRGLVLPDRDGGVGEIRDAGQEPLEVLLRLLELLVESLDLLGDLPDADFQRLGVFFFAEKPPDRLAELVFLFLETLALGDEPLATGIELLEGSDGELEPPPAEAVGHVVEGGPEEIWIEHVTAEKRR